MITPVPGSAWLQRKSADLYGCAMILCIDAEIREYFDDEAGAEEARQEAIRYQKMAAQTYLDSRVQYNRSMWIYSDAFKLNELITVEREEKR